MTDLSITFGSFHTSSPREPRPRPGGGLESLIFHYPSSPFPYLHSPPKQTAQSIVLPPTKSPIKNKFICSYAVTRWHAGDLRRPGSGDSLG